jgi:hypothetical protein
VERLDLVIEADGMSEEVLPMFAEPGGSWRATICECHCSNPLSCAVSRGVAVRVHCACHHRSKLESIRFRVHTTGLPTAHHTRATSQGRIGRRL